MEYSSNFIDSLTRQFYTIGSHSIDTSLSPNIINFTKNNIFDKMLVIDISGDEVIIPIIAKNAVECTMFTNFLGESEYQKVVIPLYRNSLTIMKRTTNSIIKEFFTNTTFSTKLKTIVTPKEDTYYGNTGIILDKDFKPLILCCVVCRKIKEESPSCMKYYKLLIYVSPDIFINGKDSVSKYILKKIIPFYSTYTLPNITISRVFSEYFLNSDLNIKPKIVIEDISSFIKTPALPNPDTCSDKALNALLQDNIEEIMSQL